MVKQMYGSCHGPINLLSTQLAGRTIQKPQKATVITVKLLADDRNAPPKFDNVQAKLFFGQMTNLFTFRSFLDY
jgi:hypothetical protein